jgi:copper chaperone CopZ
MNPEIHLKIEGMHCDGCVRRVTAALSKAPGVRVGKVEVGSATIHTDPGVNPESAADAVTKIGFAASIVPEA